jgi:hypothetical protein
MLGHDPAPRTGAARALGTRLGRPAKLRRAHWPRAELSIRLPSSLSMPHPCFVLSISGDFVSQLLTAAK